MKSKPFLLLISILIPLITGGISGYFTAEGITGWYQTLNAPSFNPPGWIFGPVWTTLYIIMGISLYLVLIKPDSALRTTAIRVFFLQLTLNFLWSFFFFYFRNIGLALVDILLMWGSIVWMIMLFRRIHPAAGYMNIPYLLWVSFATALNGAYLFLN